MSIGSSEMLAIVSFPSDGHAQYVSERMRCRNIRHVIWNLGELDDNLLLEMRFAPNASPDAEIHQGDTKVPASAVRGIWWRRPLGAYRDEAPNMLAQYVASETEAVIRSLPSFFTRARWVSDPGTTRSAGRKPVQLMHAAQAGLTIPSTFIGNSSEGAEAFLNQMADQDVVIKAVNSGFIRLNPKARDTERMNRVAYTKAVSAQFVRKNIEHLRHCPVILQEKIEKEMDIRVTVVGEQVFAMGIVARSHKDPRAVDWRRMDADRDYSLHTLPQNVERQCVELTRALGLSFGCLDFGYSSDRGYTFFEINPQGQWLVSEQVLKMPIADALIDLLVS